MRSVQQHTCEATVALRADVRLAHTCGVARMWSASPPMPGSLAIGQRKNPALDALPAFNDPFHGGVGVGS